MEQSATFRIDSHSRDIPVPAKPAILPNLNIDEISDDSLDDSVDEVIENLDYNKQPKPEHQEPEIPIIPQTPLTRANCNIKSIPIKSILKKDMHSKFTSNPDLSGIMPRDSVEITRIKSARMKRSNSFSQGIDYILSRTTDDKMGFEDDNGRKIVRFADDHYLRKKENSDSNSEGLDNAFSCQRVSGAFGVFNN